MPWNNKHNKMSSSADEQRILTNVTHDLYNALSSPREQLETAVAHLESAPFALSYANASATLLSMIKLFHPGDRILIDHNAPPLLETWNSAGLKVERLDLQHCDLAAPHYQGVKLIWTTQCSPELLAMAHMQGAWILLDSTLAPGRGMCGADLVYYGHAGCLSGQGDLTLSMLITASETLFEAWSVGRIPPGLVESLLTLRALDTLGLRLERAKETADLLRITLERHPSVKSITVAGNGVLRLELKELSALYNLTLFSGMQLGATPSSFQMRGDHALLSVGLEEARNLLGDLISALAYYGTPTSFAPEIISETPEIVEPPVVAEPSLQSIQQGVPEVIAVLPLEPISEAVAQVNPEPTIEPNPRMVPSKPSSWRPQPRSSLTEAPPETLEEALPPAPLEPVNSFEPAKQNPTEGLSEEELGRYNRLRDWRNLEAKAQEVSTFIIISNAIISAIASKNPQTLEQLGEIRGMGKERVSRYGKALLELLKKS